MSVTINFYGIHENTTVADARDIFKANNAQLYKTVVEEEKVLTYYLNVVMAIFLGFGMRTDDRTFTMVKACGYPGLSGAWVQNITNGIYGVSTLNTADDGKWKQRLSAFNQLCEDINKNASTLTFGDVYGKVAASGVWNGTVKDANGLQYDMSAARTNILSWIEDQNNKPKSNKPRPSASGSTTTLSSSVPASPAQPFEPDKNVEPMLELLKSNCQLILNGAPGTGKTWTAKNQLAPGLMGAKKYEPFRVEMVQFHPSYDYTDFIEGIRPNLDPSGSSLSYVLKNGSFKEFCCKAGVIERIKAANEMVNDSTIKKFLHLPQDDSSNDNPLFKFWQEHQNDDPLPPFLFIIDEINRAEISKVIGEVMYCLDPDYRGEKGKIHTQYATSATNDSFFLRPKDDEFFIPSNVYIVGTMNDIDRSVEVFDFALRRRFAWYEVKADEWMEPVLDNMFSGSIAPGPHVGDYLRRAAALNVEVTKVMGSRHFCLGPAYFGKLRDYFDGSNYDAALKKVWDNHICQILTEYVKGRRNADDQVNDLRNTFFGTAKSSADTADDAS